MKIVLQCLTMSLIIIPQLEKEKQLHVKVISEWFIINTNIKYCRYKT